MPLKQIPLFLFLSLPLLSFSQGENPFYLVAPDKSTTILLDSREKEVVKTAVGMFTNDLKTVADAQTKIYYQYPTHAKYLIAAGTIGNCRMIDSLVSVGAISTSEIVNKWEAFKIQVFNPKNSQQQILVVVGSDSRGTAYGLLQLSRMAGVSPWNWWADVMPAKQKSISVNANINIVQQPSVQYRGIFLNDEDWGLMPWATKTFDKSSAKGAMGPLTYQKIFELLLRLRANTIWPAMHECTVPFYLVEGNKEMADRYGIVMGTSHCEPMMRCSATEWHLKGTGEYNYATNSENVNQYWTDRVKQLSNSENIYTLGMRGVHDGDMQGAKTVEEQVALTNKVLKSQRKLVSDYLNPQPEKVPQVFIPYKEVLNIYNTGKLELPEDISLIWCDDNFGCVSRLSTPKEQSRSGGSGVYYHASYWGAPHDHLWLCTTPPAQVYTEMKRAWDYQAHKLWILNVGDIKPTEYITELFLDMAWDINAVNPQTLAAHTRDWYGQKFGEANAAVIAPLMKQYYHLATIRKPEHMGWSRTQTAGFPKGYTPIINTELNPFAFGNELQKRLDDYNFIERQVDSLSLHIAPDQMDAFFQLVKYPLQGAALMNKKLLYGQMARLLASLNLPSANEYAQLSQAAYDKIQSLTEIYNLQIAGGKWKGMMDSAPRNLLVYKKLVLPSVEISNAQGITVFADGCDQALEAQKNFDAATFIQSAGNRFLLTIYDKGENAAAWKITRQPAWIKWSTQKSEVKGEVRVSVSVDWNRLKKSRQKGELVLQCGKDNYKINLEALKIDPNFVGKQMTDGCVAFNACDYDKGFSGNAKQMEGLGYSAMALALDSSRTEKRALEYSFISEQTGQLSVCVALYPNHPANGRNKRYAVAIDGEEAQIIETESEIFKEEWKVNVLRNQSRTTTLHTLLQSGKHVLKIYALDADVILDQIMIDFKKDRKYYQISSELR